MGNKTIDKMRSIFIKKNHDYGNSAHIGYEKFGYISYIVRIHDKLMRLETLKNGETNEVKDESIEDTLLDAANYLAMLIGDILLSKKLKDNKSCDYYASMMESYELLEKHYGLPLVDLYEEEKSIEGLLNEINKELESNKVSGFAIILCEELAFRLIKEYNHRITERGTNN